MSILRRWYYARSGEVYGPFSDETIIAFARAGRLRPDDQLTAEGWDVWYPARDVSGLEAVFNAASHKKTQTNPFSPDRLRTESITTGKEAASGTKTPEAEHVFEESLTQLRNLEVLARYDDTTWSIRNMWARALCACMKRAEQLGHHDYGSQLYDELKALGKSSASTWTVKEMWAEALLTRMLRADEANDQEEALKYYQQLKELAVNRDATAHVRRQWQIAVRKKKWIYPDY